MINRVLIRIKVVQMLYSYLLTRSEFRIIEMPENPSRDKKYAFKLYHDLLMFLPQLAGQRIQTAEAVGPCRRHRREPLSVQQPHDTRIDGR